MKLPSDPRYRAWAIGALLWTVNIPLLITPGLLNGGLTPGVVATVAIFIVGGWLICAGLYEWLRVRSRGTPGSYVAAAIGGAVAGAVLLGIIDSVGDLFLVAVGLNPVRSLGYVVLQIINNTIFVGWMFAIFAAAITLMEFSQRLRQREEQLVAAESRTAQARETATAARLAALRYQLNPHFLFNTLNAVSSAVVTQRTADAETMLARLATFLRLTLSTDASAMMRLEEELGTVEAYLELEGERFRDRLSTEIICPERLRDALVPSFVLQPLIENTIKHGVSRSRNRVRLVIQIAEREDDLMIIVSDDARPLASSLPAPSSGIGLAAVRERLEVLYGSRGALVAEPQKPGFSVVLRLPLSGVAIAEAA
jgi:sensor histidine kinase YesM